MNDNPSLERLCSKCGTANPPSAAFCHQCGKALDGRGGSVADDLMAKGRQVLGTPTGKQVATGVAIGAVAGTLLPILSLPIGAIIGGAVAYARLKR